MNFKSVTINLLLTTLSAGVLLQTLEAQAASITFGAWNFNPPTVTKNPTDSRFATGGGNATQFTLKAFAKTTATNNPLSWGTDSAKTIVSLSNFFTVTPETGEKNGDKVRGFLSGRLTGLLDGNRPADVKDEGSFNSSVVASVNAGFASWNSGKPTLVGKGLDYSLINLPINEEGILTIGEQYQFNMSLEVFAEKTGISQTSSIFSDDFSDDGQGFTVNIRTEPTPEPLTMLASATALGFGAFFKRQHSKKPKKS